VGRTARFAGSVHGVVVQMTSRAFLPASLGSGSDPTTSKAT
jgi:hypothetical protein